MSDDFVKQMRDFCAGLPNSFQMPPAWIFMMEAADRLERMESALRRIEENEDQFGMQWAAKVARAALDGKND